VEDLFGKAHPVSWLFLSHVLSTSFIALHDASSALPPCICYYEDPRIVRTIRRRLATSRKASGRPSPAAAASYTCFVPSTMAVTNITLQTSMASAADMILGVEYIYVEIREVEFCSEAFR
jgi:hypothetical protein